MCKILQKTGTPGQSLDTTDHLLSGTWSMTSKWLSRRDQRSREGPRCRPHISGNSSAFLVLRGDTGNTIARLCASFLLLASLAGQVLADGNLNEVLVYDSTRDTAPQDEGLIRSRLGLLDANGKPLVDPSGDPVPLVSSDGTKSAFDMKGGTGTTVKTAFGMLISDGGTFTLISHGRKGLLRADGQRVAGFGPGTGADTALTSCPPKPPLQLDGAGAKTNLTINLVVCEARASDPQIAAVSDTLRIEINSLGGSVSTMNDTATLAQVKTTKCWRIAPGVELTPEEELDVNTAIHETKINHLPFKDHYATLQNALDNAAGGPNRVIATIQYTSPIFGTRFQGEQFTCSGDSDEETGSTCENCVGGFPMTSKEGLVLCALLLMIAGAMVLNSEPGVKHRRISSHGGR